MSGALAKIYLLAGGALMVGYLAMETRGVVFSGTDSKPAIYSSRGRRGGRSSTRRGRGGGGVFFWGSGYRGGK